MKKIVFAVTVMSSLVFSGGDIADPVSTVPLVEKVNGFYTGIGIAAVSTRRVDFTADFFNTEEEQDRLGNVTLLAGYNFSRYLAAETRYTTSFTHDEAIEMDGWSIFVKPQYPVNDELSFYALLGYGNVSLEGSKPDGIVDVDDSTLQWGLGLNYMITDNVSLFADYTWLANGMDGDYNGVDKVDVDVITVGVNYYF